MRNLILLLIFCSFNPASAQNSDSLYYKRSGFNTSFFINNQIASNEELKELYSFDKKTLRKFNIGRFMLPAAPVLSIAGTAIAVDGLVGVKRTAQIDGKNYDYVERSLPKLLIGLALFVTGGSFMEGSNDLKTTAAKRYNAHIQKINSSPKTTFRPQLGITAAGGVGFRLEF